MTLWPPHGGGCSAGERARRLRERYPGLRELDGGEEVEEETVDNPRYAELQMRIHRVERGLERAAAAQAVRTCSEECRKAEKRLQRLMTEGYPTSFKVLEYARPDTSPVRPSRREIAAVERGACRLAALLTLAALPIWLSALRRLLWP